MARYVRFLLAGLPSALLALPLNMALVELAHWPKTSAYGVVLAFQVSLNYFFCRRFVFLRPRGSSEASAFSAFTFIVGFFRLLDWATYTLVVSRVDLWYGWVQLFNMAVFSVAKYFSCRFALDGPQK
jgi:putative flippase GtrA